MTNFSKSNWSGQGFDFTMTTEDGVLVGRNEDFTIRYQDMFEYAEIDGYNITIHIAVCSNDVYEAFSSGLSRTAQHPLVAAFQIAYNLI